MNQLSLFPDEEIKPTVNRPKRNGGSGNPIVFHDYESFIAKFADNPKTTDDCYTPPDIYEAVVKWLGTKIDLTGKQILRPFYPGGDYVMAEYPEDGIVIDNPPFSIFTKIVQFYATRNVPFFLFGPGLTISTCCRWCTAIYIANQIRFSNGAMVRCNFASNLFGDAVMWSCPDLARMLENCPSQDTKANLPKYLYPDELCSSSDMQSIARGDLDFIVHRDECRIIRELDRHPKSGLFGDHLLLSSGKAAAKAAAARAIPVPLSDREARIVSRLENHDTPDNYPLPPGCTADDDE